MVEMLHTILCLLLVFSCVVRCTNTGCYDSDSSKQQIKAFGGMNPTPLLVDNSSLFAPRNCFSTTTLDQPNFCYPTVLVAGFPKCATSYLFHALSSHPFIIPARRKELCLGGPLSESWSKLVTYLPTAEDANGKLVLAGCLHLGANIRAVNELCVAGNVRVIYLVRDVADMLWAAYNYWCNVETDGPSCIPGKHTDPGRDIRTPELFHERVKKALPMGGGYPLSSSGVCFRKDLIRAKRVFGYDNVFVIKSEDMLDSDLKPEVLRKLLSFLQLDGEDQLEVSLNWLNFQLNNHYMINSGMVQSSKGVHNKVIIDRTNSSFKKGLYEASGYAPMLTVTRKLIYQRWKRECIFLRNRHGIHYPSCKKRRIDNSKEII